MFRRFALAGVLSIIVFTMTSFSSAETTKVEGIIKSRNGETMTLQLSGGPDVVVLLSDETEVGQVQGALKARRKQMSMAALIPGLAVKVEGDYNDQSQFVATSVLFKGDDLEQAQAQANEAELQAQNAALKEQQAAIDKQQQEIAANKAKIAANSARFGQLDDFYILDEVTVYFDNGKVNVDPKYVPSLLELAQKAKIYNGYNIQVKGYASAVGSAALNQELSEERAESVTDILVQQGHVPLTNMLAPGAMGESRQVGNDKTEKGQAENRRVVVRALLNKGIAGTELPLAETKK